jgi:hypothetical protein
MRIDSYILANVLDILIQHPEFDNGDWYNMLKQEIWIWAKNHGDIILFANSGHKYHTKEIFGEFELVEPNKEIRT